MQKRTTTNAHAQVRQLLTEVFEHQALQLAGLAADGDLTDELTWQLVRVLDDSHRRAARRLRAITRGLAIRATVVEATPHPAISEFLRRLRSGGP